MNDDRANRLRERRQESREKAEAAQTDVSHEQEEKSEPSKPSEPSGPENAEQTDETDESDETSVKDERVGTYMYLPESQKDEMKRQYNYLKADYETEYDGEFEKNRHFYPLVAEYGLDSLDELSPSDVRERLEKNNWLE